MADRKYGRIFTLSDVDKILEHSLMGDENDAGRLIDEMDEHGVRFKFGKDEPTFTFRARDKRSIGALRFYEDHQHPRAPMNHCEGIEDARREFEEYREKHPEMMKEPD